jgi:CTP synthase (UTP-ammonia lyase)
MPPVTFLASPRQARAHRGEMWTDCGAHRARGMKRRAATLEAMRFVRERGVPYLGTCAGFQHALIGLTRNVLGIPTLTAQRTSRALGTS